MNVYKKVKGDRSMKKQIRTVAFAMLACCLAGFTACGGGEHEHAMTKHEAVVAGCETDGNTEYYACGDCGKYFADAEGATEITENSWVIEATGHDLTKHDAVSAECEADGNTEYYDCDNCDKYFADENAETEVLENSWVLDATGHDYDENGACANCTTVATDAEMVELGYVAKANGVYYKALAQAVENAGSKTVYLLADNDEDVTLGASSVIIVKKDVNYTGTVSGAKVEIQSDLKVYASTFSVAFAKYSAFSPDSKAVSITLLEDVSLTKQHVVNRGTALTLNLNGYDVTTTANAYTKLFLVKDNFTITSNATGSEIKLANAGFMQVSSDYTDSVVEVSNVAISRTATSGTELILNYATMEMSNSTVTLAGANFIKNYGSVSMAETTVTLPGGSTKVFANYGDLTLENGTEINVTTVLGTSFIDASVGDVLINGATFNVAGFKVNGGSFFWKAVGINFVVQAMELNIVLDETYTSYAFNKMENVQLANVTGTVQGATCNYEIGEDGKWKALS